MELRLEPEEAALLARILTNYLSDLRMEVGATENYEWRQSLKHDEAVVKELLSRLPAATTSAPSTPESAARAARPNA